MNVWHIALWVYMVAGEAILLAIAFSICRKDAKKGKSKSWKQKKSPSGELEHRQAPIKQGKTPLLKVYHIVCLLVKPYPLLPTKKLRAERRAWLESGGRFVRSLTKATTQRPRSRTRRA